MKSYNPQFSLRIATSKQEFVLDTHRDVLSLIVSRKLGQTAGAFQISLLPRPQSGKSWENLISPMDYVEIKMWTPQPEDSWPIYPVMRGFVDRVQRSFAIAEGRPQEIITIAGRDYGKLLLMTKLFTIGANIPQIFDLYKRWQEGFQKLFGWGVNVLPDPLEPPLTVKQLASGPNFSPSMIQKVTFESFYQPVEKEILKTFAVAPPTLDFDYGMAEKDDFDTSARTYSPGYTPKGVEPFSDVWSLMYAYQHRPWRELFMADVDKPILVYRPAPWLDLQGKLVQEAANGEMGEWEIANRDLISWSLSRTDINVLNFFFTYPEAYAGFGMFVQQGMSPYEGMYIEPGQVNPHLVSHTVTLPYTRSDFQRFGLRYAQFPTPFLDWERGMHNAMWEERTNLIRNQGGDWNRRLVAAMDHAHLLESGTLEIRGDHRIQIGDYVRLAKRGNARYYVTSVAHKFQQGTQSGDGHFFTYLEVDRGRGHLVEQYGLPE